MTRWVNAGVVESRFEGDRVSQALKEAGIPYMIQSFLDTAYDGLFLPQKGWGRVMVPEEFCGQAEKVVADVRIYFKEEVKDEAE